jgi:hypothetical protein
MIHNNNHQASQKVARIAGLMFLFSLLFPLLNWTFVLSRLTVANDVAATAKNIMAHEFLFRISIVNELILSVSVIVTALVLYILLKPVHKNLALLALLWRLAEAVTIAVLGLLGFIALQVSDGENLLTTITPEKMQLMTGFFLNVHMNISASFTMFFIGLGLTTFSYLFFKSKYIPEIISFLGILSYSLIFIYAILNILVPDHPEIIQVICWTPSIIFEITIGLWLMIKGVKIQQMN